MAFLTLSEVRSKARSNKKFGLESRDILEEQFDSFNQYKIYDIFLSHAFLDAEAIDGLRVVLKEAGFSVYVDWYEDSHLERGKVTKETAVVIRKRMQSCKTLIFAITENSEDSRWMLWELGYFDGLKDKVAVLGLIENSGDSFRGQEFLELYPFVERHDLGLVVKDDSTKPAKLLRDWVKS
ncbi:toll/interleukin-1 receptor domain-containing protein [Psychrobacter sp. Ps4]|uniref:TIR domain-containing protein n=1 Tax=Psychrobacter sp. Ps4 TaxID=2790958 RepID=UPI001EDF456E|nr:TIR domain-containing protein [Psychrobacter sp. Ps4]MCG3808188.1 toll/interleukin-1 receptor domain-containing protein [Psychrobacter sp. Ps4]